MSEPNSPSNSKPKAPASASPARQATKTSGGSDASRQAEELRTEVLGLVKKGHVLAAFTKLEMLLKNGGSLDADMKSWAEAEIAKCRSHLKRELHATKALVPTAQNLIDNHDYQQAAQILEQIPVRERTAEIEDLLQQANDLNEEVDLLVKDLRRAVEQKEFSGIRDNLDRLLEIKPGNKFARELDRSLRSYGGNQKYRFSPQGKLLPHEDSGLFEGAKAVILVGILAFAVVSAMVVLYLRDKRQVVTIEVDPSLVRDGSVSLVVEGETVEIKGLGETVKLVPGDHGYEVRRGDQVIVGPTTFNVRRGEKNVLTISVANRVQDVASNQNATALPDKPAATPAASTPPATTSVAAAPVDVSNEAAESSSDTELKVSSLKLLSPVRTFDGHTDRINSLDFSPDGARLATASKDKRVKIWDPVTGNLLLSLEHPQPVEKAVFSANGEQIISAGLAGVKFWNSRTGAEEGEIAGDHRIAWFSPDGAWMASGATEGVKQLWDLPARKMVRPLASAWFWHFSRDGSRVAAIGSRPGDKMIFIWETKTSKAIGRITSADDSLRGPLVWMPDGEHLLSGNGQKSRISLWNVKTKQRVREFQRYPNGTPSHFALSADGRRLLSSHGGLIAMYWDVETGTALGKFSEGDSTTKIALTANATLAACHTVDFKIKIYDLSGQ